MQIVTAWYILLHFFIAIYYIVTRYIGYNLHPYKASLYMSQRTAQVVYLHIKISYHILAVIIVYPQDKNNMQVNMILAWNIVYQPLNCKAIFHFNCHKPFNSQTTVISVTSFYSLKNNQCFKKIIKCYLINNYCLCSILRSEY